MSMIDTTLTTSTYQDFATSDADDIEQDKLLLLDELLTARGYGNRKSAKDLAGRTGINASTVRDAIIDLREQYNIPVANRGSGYFLITNADELDAVLAYYQQEIETKRERKRTITKAFNQTAMNLGDIDE